MTTKKTWTKPQLKELVSIVKTGECCSTTCLVCPMDTPHAGCLVLYYAGNQPNSLRESAEAILSDYLKDFIEKL